MKADRICDVLLHSCEPSIHRKTRVLILGEDPTTARIHALESQIRGSARVRALLARRDAGGVLNAGRDPHWVLAALADLGYPKGDASLFAMRDQVLNRWSGDQFFREFDAMTAAQAYRGRGVPPMPSTCSLLRVALPSEPPGSG